MTAVFDRRHQLTMSDDEVSLSSTFAPLSSTSLSAHDVYFALPVHLPASPTPAQRPTLRPSLIDPVSRLVDLMPNWDGFEAAVPSVGALKWTVRVLAALPDLVPDPRVLPSTDGGVLLEWEEDEVELLLSMGEQGFTGAVVSFNGIEEQEGDVAGLLQEITNAFMLLADRA